LRLEQIKFMKMTLILSILIFLSSSCKTDTQSSVVPTNETKSVVSKAKEVQEKPVATLEKNVNQAEKSEIKETVESSEIVVENKENTTVLKEKPKTATKSIPKPEPKEFEEAIEKVEVPVSKSQEVKETKTEKDKSIPKPEPKEFKEEVEQVETKVEKNDAPLPVKISHADFDALLSKYVSNNGVVNYAGFKNNVSKLDTYLDALTNTKLSSLSKNEKLAFWINAYNAYTIKLILNNYPVNSITDLEGGKPWDKKWINLDGKTLSLNNIENDIIRPTFNEPRIHFAVNCAAKSCPPLLNKAWTASNLESNFEKQTKKFVNNSQYNNISASSIKISQIFNWYKVDFGNVVSFLNKYSNVKIDANAQVEHLEYDWALNKK